MKNTGMLLWLDDTRNPMEGDWLVFSPIKPKEVIWVKSYKDFVSWITKNGLPEAICFDHDLGDLDINNATYVEKTGYDAAKWLVEYCIESRDKLPLYNVQSANNVGKENIIRYLENYKKLYE